MKNHRKIVSLIALLISFLLIISFYGCRTSKKIVEKSKVDIEKSELKINKIDSSISIQKNNNLNKIDSLSWSSYMKEINFSFKGLDNNDELEIIKLNNGWKFKGKGIINGKSIDNKKDSLNSSNNHQIINERLKLDSSSKSEVKSNDSQIEIDKNKENQTLGFTIGVLVALILLGALMIYLIYKYFIKK
ncbi:hypothetical protein [Chishuiella sp.]|uniref:hypothetical protein n=1 Tax=Chishuiella sp. TaxID=1969467 RepID=UPI0028A64AE3|nr:hypothetical protein [Chishuiella sp.]